MPQTRMEPSPPPALGVQRYYPRKNFEILCAESCNFVHTRTVLLARNESPELYIFHTHTHTHKHNFCTLNCIGSSGLCFRILLNISPDNLVIR